MSWSAAWQKLNQLRDLPAGWDSYDARPIAPEAIAAARSFLRLIEPWAPAPFVAPVANGAVQLEWEHFLELTFDGKIIDGHCGLPPGDDNTLCAVGTWRPADEPPPPAIGQLSDYVLCALKDDEAPDIGQYRWEEGGGMWLIIGVEWWMPFPAKPRPPTGEARSRGD